MGFVFALQQVPDVLKGRRVVGHAVAFGRVHPRLRRALDVDDRPAVLHQQRLGKGDVRPAAPVAGLGRVDRDFGQDQKHGEQRGCPIQIFHRSVIL